MYLKFFKRFFDIFFVIIVVLIISPVFICIMIVNFLLNGNPIFFTHSRLGCSGKLFNVYKFRTMHLDADGMLQKYFKDSPDDRKNWNEKHKLINDPRINNFGFFLRRYSLDELPQLLNVLKGEMSLVGPRPIVNDEVEKYGDSFNFYKKVKPGITGLWQVSGRNDIRYNKRVELDVFYARNISFLLDLSILFRTLPVIIFKKGAY